jgi:hypothetical protein
MHFLCILLSVAHFLGIDHRFGEAGIVSHCAPAKFCEDFLPFAFGSVCCWQVSYLLLCVPQLKRNKVDHTVIISCLLTGQVIYGGLGLRNSFTLYVYI